MTLLNAYLNKAKVKKILASKPGQEGFSLIELVVVVAVLAVLSAIAIPQFTNISSKARAAAASNTLATIAKECASKIADVGVGANAKFVVPNLQGYTTGGAAGFFMSGSKVTGGTEPQCINSGAIEFRSENTAEYPSFSYDTSTGKKVCTATGNALNRGCDGAPGVW
tara:strand:+ start:892 stop:1392 length:501 start_codon:yes stop_codon:yes gene_type:complete